MKSSLTKTLRAVPLACASLLLAGAAHAALQDRDLNGDTVVDAFYDTDRNFTWLRSANPDEMNWASADAWVRALSLGGYTGWQLPTGDFCNVGPCISNDLSHLWYTELGNSEGGPMTNKGGFQNPQPGPYWTNKIVAFLTASTVNFGTGDVAYTPSYEQHYVLPVHYGDIGRPIPEPETYALMLAGLAGLAIARRLQRH